MWKEGHEAAGGPAREGAFNFESFQSFCCLKFSLFPAFHVQSCNLSLDRSPTPAPAYLSPPSAPPLEGGGAGPHLRCFTPCINWSCPTDQYAFCFYIIEVVKDSPLRTEESDWGLGPARVPTHLSRLRFNKSLLPRTCLDRVAR